MTRIAVKEFIFDDQNLKHISKHNVVEAEIREAGQNLIYHRRTYKGRYLLIGRSKKRLLTLILNCLSPGKYYVVTARDASKKERRVVYEKESSK